MKPVLLLRLTLDFVAACLLLAAFAYNLAGNLAHEIIGTLMFALLIGHNLCNRRWYGTLIKGRLEPRSLITKGVNLSLLISMLALLTTSVIISQAVFSFLPLASSVSARQIHTLVGYVALLVASVHLGLHWTMIMGVTRRLTGITSESRIRTYVLRIVALAIGAFGIDSLIVLNIGSKLLMEMSLFFWDFERDAAEFFLRHAAIIGLGTILGHYALQLGRRRTG